MSFKKSFKVFVVFIGIIMFSSCTKEKAEALQLAAEQFRIDAISAIDQINYIFLQEISIVQPTEEEKVKKVNAIFQDPKAPLKSELLDLVANQSDPGRNAIAVTNTQFESLKRQYYEFEKMFTSLDKGSYFAKDAVNKAERHAVNLTLQLINYANILQNNEYTFSANRAIILIKLKEARKDTIKALREEHINDIAVEFIQLLENEKQAKEKAIRECYRAAENGSIVLDLIKNYDKMSLSDILNTIKGSLAFAMEITDGNQNIADLKTKFEGVERMIVSEYGDKIDETIFYRYKKEQETKNKAEIESQIQIVVADSVFTEIEKTHISRIAEKYNGNKDEIFTEIDKRIDKNNKAKAELDSKNIIEEDK